LGAEAEAAEASGAAVKAAEVAEASGTAVKVEKV
jgi:hypothetical protein